MSIKPILFNTEMVRAILDGRKTVTRRVVKRKGYDEKIHNPKNDYAYNRKDGCWVIGYDARPIRGWPQGAVAVSQPYQIGDILYVRETWKVQAAHRFESDVRIMFKAGGPLSTIQFPGRNSQATSRDDYDAFIDKWMQGDGWKPSIHMPREAARIWLRVTDVRAERLQEITDEDIVAEGLQIGCYFDDLWDSTIKPADRERYGWAANPWVWIIEFERCEKPDGDNG